MRTKLSASNLIFQSWGGNCTERLFSSRSRPQHRNLHEGDTWSHDCILKFLLSFAAKRPHLLHISSLHSGSRIVFFFVLNEKDEKLCPSSPAYRRQASGGISNRANFIFDQPHRAQALSLPRQGHSFAKPPVDFADPGFLLLQHPDS